MTLASNIYKLMVSSTPQNQVVSLIPSMCSVAKVQKMHQFVSGFQQKVCLCISTKRESSVTTAVVTNLRKPAAGRIPRMKGGRMEIMTTIQPSGNPKFAIFCPCSEITNEPFEALVLGGWRGRSSVNLIEPRNFSFRGLNVLKCLSFPIDFWWKWNVL